MRKLTLLAVFAAAVLFVGAGCDVIAGLDKPSVTATAIENGAKLRLNWTAVTDANAYEIVVDGTTFTVQSPSTEYDVTGPAKEVKVYAKNGDVRSDAFEIDCEVVETTIDVYGISDPEPTHPSAFGFTTDGTAATYAINAGNYAAIDFYMENVQLPMSFVNPGDKGWNAKGNAAKEATSTVYDDVDIADAPGSGYTTQQAAVAGGVYSLWVDVTNNGWDATDHFAKAKVVSVDGVKVTLKIGYQKVAGLRWVMN